MKYFIIFCAAAGLLASCASMSGNGNVIKENRGISDFDKIRTSGSIDVVISTGRAKFYLGSIPVADIYFNQTWIYRDNRWQFIFWQGTMTGAPASYPVYFTLIGTLLIVGVVYLVIRRFGKKKAMMKAA